MKYEGKLKAVIYARYSSEGQREESITGQLRDCHKYAKSKGYEVIHEYVDQALTGKTDERPAFQKMIADSDHHAFQIVIVWKIDRFARNRYDSAIYRYNLGKNGARIVSAMEAISEGPEGIIMEGLLESMAEYYSANLSENVKRGNMDSALEHKTLGTKVYGYRRTVDDHYEPDPETAPIVKRIFTEYASGKPVKDICDDLNSENIPNQAGKQWGKNSLRNMIKNEKYTGVYIFKDMRDEGGMPVIIDKDIFERAQVVAGRHKKSPAASRDSEYILTGKLFCGKCGKAMTGEYAVGKSGKRYSYYNCVGRKDGHCDKKRVGKEMIESLVVNFIMDAINNNQIIDRIVDAIMDIQEKENSDNSTLNIIHAAQKRNDKELANIEKAIAAGIIGDTTARMLAEHEEEKRKLDASEAKELLRIRPVITEEQIRSWLIRFRQGEVNSISFRRKIVDVFLSSIYLYDDGKAIINLNFSGSDATKTVKMPNENRESLKFEFGTDTPA